MGLLRRRRRPPDLDHELTNVVRTWFIDQELWEALRRTVETPTEDGFLAVVDFVDDEFFDGASDVEIAALVPSPVEHSLIVVADEVAHQGGGLLALQPAADGPPRRLRVGVESLWSIENNMSLANMEWEDFVDGADDDGVFRMFG